jgi:hypothetical protein
MRLEATPGRRFWIRIALVLLVLSLSASTAPVAPPVIVDAAQAMIEHFLQALSAPVLQQEDTSDKQE